MKIPTESGPETRRRGSPVGAGFSLLELLITLALILIMSAMFYGFGSRSHQQSQKAACRKNLLNLSISLNIFANDHEGAFPAVPAAQTAEEPLALLVPRYTVETSSFICPGSKDSPLPPGESLLRRKISYAYLMGLHLTNTATVVMTDRQVDTRPKTTGQRVFSVSGESPGNNHHKYGGNLLFVDGHVEMIPAALPFSLNWPEGALLLNPKP